MNKTLGVFAVSFGLAIGGQEALANDKSIKISNPQVGNATEEVRGNVENCIGPGMGKILNGECVIMVDLVNSSPIINQVFESELIKKGKEMQNEELIKFWGGIVGIIGLFGGLIAILSKNSRSIDDKESLKKLLNELKENFTSINEKYPDWFLLINNIEIAEIKDELASGIEELRNLISEKNQVDTEESISQRKLAITKLEELKKKTEKLVIKFKRENKDYQNRKKIEEALR